MTANVTLPKRSSLVGAVAVLAVAALFVFGTGLLGRHEVRTPAPPSPAPAVSLTIDPLAAAAAAVDWTGYRPGFRAELEADDCDQLAFAYEAANLTAGVVDPVPLQAFITAVQDSKGCSP